MRSLLGACCVVTMLAVTSVTHAQDNGIEGAWVLTTITDADGNEQDALPGLFVFSSTHYSMMYTIGDGPRPQYPGPSATDAELLTAYNTFIANSGRYSVDGDQLTFRAYVAKDPNYQAGWPENATTVTVNIDGDTRLWSWGEGFAPAVGQVYTFSRVEGRPAPWD